MGPHYNEHVRTRQVPLDQLSVRYVKGVGPARAERLKRLGIHTVEDALLAVPRRYEDRSHLAPIHTLRPGQLATVRGQVVSTSFRRAQGGRPIVEAAVSDSTGIISCRWFNQPYLAQQLHVGDELILYGQLEPSHRLQLVHPEIERVDGQRGEETGDASLHMGRIVPVYSLTEGITQRWFRRMIQTLLTQYAGQLDEVLPESLRKRHQLQPLAWSIQYIHFPESWETLQQAQWRLVFEELFLMQVRLALRRARLLARKKPQRYQPEGALTTQFLRRLPFALTHSQQQVLKELVSDLCKPSPMLRLLQGDVGCGKTVVAALLMAIAVQSGYQAALMAPTELLAEQHHGVLSAYFEPLRVKVRLMSQQIGASQRKSLLEEIGKGTVGIVVGTHALIESSVSFKNLALVVIDEQHKFGVVQRSALARKATTPDVLVMTATPIPRTLALSLYGDLTCSTITELPPGRLPIRTLLLDESQRAEAYRIIRDELRQDRQGYVVYPLIDAHNRRELKAATQMARHLQTDVFPNSRVALLHGQMRPATQQSVMRGFADGQIHLLVSTVIVEVGLDIPNATVMLIEHPEQFGLAQLHQMRGRIGRGAQPATCLLITQATDDTVRKRLSAFVETADGFRLAEHDLSLRGPGELLGKHQHGWLRFRVADLLRDQAMLELAREEAINLVASDPALARPEVAALKARLGASRGRVRG